MTEPADGGERGSHGTPWSGGHRRPCLREKPTRSRIPPKRDSRCRGQRIPQSPWENGYNESLNGTPGDEVLKREIFFTLTEAKVLIEQ